MGDETRGRSDLMFQQACAHAALKAACAEAGYHMVRIYNGGIDACPSNGQLAKVAQKLGLTTHIIVFGVPSPYGNLDCITLAAGTEQIPLFSSFAKYDLKED